MAFEQIGMEAGKTAQDLHYTNDNFQESYTAGSNELLRVMKAKTGVIGPWAGRLGLAI